MISKYKLLIICTYIDEFFPDVGSIVWIWVVGVHVLDGVEYPLRVKCVVVLVDVIIDHCVEEVPANVVVRGQRLVVV